MCTRAHLQNPSFSTAPTLIRRIDASDEAATVRLDAQRNGESAVLGPVWRPLVAAARRPPRLPCLVGYLQPVISKQLVLVGVFNSHRCSCRRFRDNPSDTRRPSLRRNQESGSNRQTTLFNLEHLHRPCGRRLRSSAEQETTQLLTQAHRRQSVTRSPAVIRRSASLPLTCGIVAASMVLGESGMTTACTPNVVSVPGSRAPGIIGVRSDSRTRGVRSTGEPPPSSSVARDDVFGSSTWAAVIRRGLAVIRSSGTLGTRRATARSSIRGVPRSRRPVLAVWSRARARSPR